MDGRENSIGTAALYIKLPESKTTGHVYSPKPFAALS
jgi:hypothetical protein